MKLKKELRVAISGKSGCGNTTVSTLLSQKLGIKLINYTFRQLAAEKGLTLAQVIENAKNDDSYDKYVDTHQVELAEKESCVLGSRLAIWMLKEADFKVYKFYIQFLRKQSAYCCVSAARFSAYGNSKFFSLRNFIIHSSSYSIFLPCSLMFSRAFFASITFSPTSVN